jgi:hypothetical protein
VNPETGIGRLFAYDENAVRRHINSSIRPGLTGAAMTVGRNASSEVVTHRQRRRAKPNVADWTGHRDRDGAFGPAYPYRIRAMGIRDHLIKLERNYVRMRERIKAAASFSVRRHSETGHSRHR